MVWLLRADISRTVFSFLIFGIIKQKQTFQWMILSIHILYLQFVYFVKSKYTFTLSIRVYVYINIQQIYIHNIRV